jgi:hypothetical protein
LDKKKQVNMHKSKLKINRGIDKGLAGWWSKERYPVNHMDQCAIETGLGIAN